MKDRIKKYFISFYVWLKKTFIRNSKLVKESKIDHEIKAKSDDGVIQIIDDSHSSEINNKYSEDVELKQRKPYKKKSPTDETQIKRRHVGTIKTGGKKPISLGDTFRARQKKNSNYPKTENEKENNENDVEVSEKERAFRIQAPYFEISLNEGKVYIVFPEQLLELDSIPLSEQIVYSVEINGKKKEISTRVRIHNETNLSVDEAKITLDEPFSKFKVIYPEILQQREYNYTHNDKSLYFFVAVGNDRGRMFYSFDPAGNPNPLPKKNLWILLKDNLEVGTEGILRNIEEIWIWENYQPNLVDTSEISSLEIRGKSDEGKKYFGLEKSFQLEGELLVGDDFRKESPLFSGTTVKITAPYVYDEGWRVWISEKRGNYKLVSDNWTGETPLELKCPEDLPCNYGEFQIDICPPGSRISDDTLFFRWIPTIKLNYDRQLTLPNRNSGHESAKLSLCFDDCSRWKVVSQENYPVELVDNAYLVTLPAEKDSARLHISQHEQSDISVVIQASIPRLRWRTSMDDVWLCTPIKVSARELESGKQFDLIMKTNDIYGKYVFEGILKHQEKQLQIGNFKRKGMGYVLPLNQFFDTIKSHRGITTLITKIWTDGRGQCLGMIEPILFETEDIPTVYSNMSKTKEVKIQVVEKIEAKVFCRSGSAKRRTAKGFSKNELNTAGLSLSDSRRWNIPFDKRRKSCRAWNVETLRSLKSDK